MNEEKSPVTDFYEGQNLFITGATGFVGVCLVEKILRDIPKSGKLYLLMRPKKKKTIEERLEELKKNSVFEKLNETASKDIFKRLVPIQGDVGESNLGISDEDRKTLIDNVNIVIHSAATLDFFENLKTTANINLKGTRRVMDLCAQMRNLKAMVHVSSAFVNSYMLEPKEILYPAPDNADKIIELSENLEEIPLKELEPKLLKDHPNTYTFTKHLAEHEVNKYATQFPCGIVRPSMIIAAWKEPMPGWTISKNGPQGFFMGASKGVIRRLPLDPSIITDYIPVDVVVNQILVTGYHIHRKFEKHDPQEAEQISIFHCTSSTYKPFRFNTMLDQVNEYLHLYPLNTAVWYPHLKISKNLLLFRIAAIFFHFIPGFFLDLVTRIAGGRPILIKLHINVWNSLKTLERFIFTEWKYDNSKTLQLAKSLDEVDRKKFIIDIGELKWEDFFSVMVFGVRKYLHKESPDTIEVAKKRQKILLGLHVILQLLFYYGMFCLFQALLGISSAKAALILPVFYFLFNIL